MTGEPITDIVEKDWLNTYLPVELKQWVRRRAAESDLTMSAWVVELIQREHDRVEST